MFNHSTFKRTFEDAAAIRRAF